MLKWFAVGQFFILLVSAAVFVFGFFMVFVFHAEYTLPSATFAFCALAAIEVFLAIWAFAMKETRGRL